MMKEIETRIKEVVKDLFTQNKIDLFIGYSKGSLPLTSSPCFITKSEDIEKLVWNSFCSNNLAVYLPRIFNPQPRKKEKIELPRIGILAKGCDARSIVVLIKEHQIARDNVFILGIVCQGMGDRKKIRNDIEITGAEEKNGRITIVDENKKEIELKREELLSDCCIECQHATPPIHDILIESGNQRPAAPKGGGRDIEKKSIEDRWNLFKEEISKCIRCYACRQACPNCYCRECFADQTKPRWIGVTDHISDVMFYQIGRIFHQAGRCVDCGACVRACPMGIDLRVFTHKLVRDAKELFDYEAGVFLEEGLLLATFKPEDKQEFISEP